VKPVVFVIALASLGCDAESLEPLRPDGGAAPDAAWAGASCADEAVVRARVFEARCADSDCHDADDPEAGLDLVSPGIRARVEAARSVHEDCADRALVVPGNSRASFLMDKVLGLEATCGDPMPLEGDLSLAQRRCLVEWIDAMQ